MGELKFEQTEIDFSRKPEYENEDIFQFPTKEVDQFNDRKDGYIQVIDKEKGIFKNLLTGETISLEDFDSIPNKIKIKRHLDK